MWPVSNGQCCFMLLLVLSPLAVRQDVVRTQCASLKFLPMLDAFEIIWIHPKVLAMNPRGFTPVIWWPVDGWVGKKGGDVEGLRSIGLPSSGHWNTYCNYMIYDICGCFDLLLLHCTMRLAIVDKPTNFSHPTAESGICTDFSIF